MFKKINAICVKRLYFCARLQSHSVWIGFSELFVAVYESEDAKRRTPYGLGSASFSGWDDLVSGL